MKAEERKEMETNALRAWMARWRARTQGRGLYVLIGSVVVLLAVVFGYRYWRSAKEAAASARLMDLISADSEKKLDEIINSPNHQGKPTQIWARLQKARLTLYRDGLDKLGTANPDDRAKAFAKLEEGKKLYLDLVNDLKDWPALQQEVYFSCAKAEEALLGAPKEGGGSEEYRGSFDRLLDFWAKAAAINSDSEPSKSYAALAEKKKNNRAEIEKFYQDLYRYGSTPKLGPLP